MMDCVTHVGFGDANAIPRPVRRSYEPVRHRVGCAYYRPRYEVDRAKLLADIIQKYQLPRCEVVVPVSPPQPSCRDLVLYRPQQFARRDPLSRSHAARASPDDDGGLLPQRDVADHEVASVTEGVMVPLVALQGTPEPKDDLPYALPAEPVRPASPLAGATPPHDNTQPGDEVPTPTTATTHPRRKKSRLQSWLWDKLNDPRVASAGNVVFGQDWQEDFIHGGFRHKLRMLGQIVHYLETPRVILPPNHKRY